VTLDETYERILTSIPAENCQMACAVLQWISGRMGGCMVCWIREVAEAAVVDYKNCTFYPEKRLLDPMYLLEILSSLVTLAPHNGYDYQLEFAHFSVEECLVSERIRVGPAAAFHISNRSATLLPAKTCLTYLLYIDYQLLDCLELDKQREIFPFLESADLC
jgi:hypothetical protein